MTQELALVVFMNIIGWRSCRVLNTLIPHPHQTILRQTPLGGLASNPKRVDAITEQRTNQAKRLAKRYCPIDLC